MKNLFLAAALLCSAVSFSQFSSQWQQIDSLEIAGRIESADELVSGILQTARKNKDFDQLIKAKIYHYKFYQVNHEDSDQYILKDINQTISQLPVPPRNVLQSYKGQFLYQYFSRHRWRIKRRKEIDNPDAKDIATWSEATLQDSIRSSFESSLLNKQQLKKTPVYKIAELLEPEPLNRKYKPSIYDLLAYKALDYFSDTSNFPPVKPSAEYDLEASELFGTTSQFLKLKFPQAAQYTSAVVVLKTFQELEDVHSEEKDPTGLVFAQLQRLKFVFTNTQKWEKYMQALDRLSNKYKGTRAEPLLLYTRALAYYEKAGNKDENGELLHSGFNQKAVELGEKIIKDYPNTEMEQRAFSLISAIKAVELNIQVPDYLLPNNAGRMLLSYKSIDSVSLQVFKVPVKFPREYRSYQDLDEIEELKKKDTALFSKTLQLPRSEDFNFHSTEALLPELEQGTYLLIVSGRNSFGKKGYSYGFVKVTNLSLSQTSFEKTDLYRALNRRIGFPEKDVRLKWIFEKGVSRERTTDKNGEVFIKKSSDYSRLYYVIATKAGDTLISDFWEGYYGGNDEEDDPIKAKTLLYLDRAIYRPGQKVYFKGVLLSHKKGRTRTVPNDFVEVYVDDPNGEEVASFRLKTNKYGSFSGEFLLPKNGITGSFSIYTEEDTESETPFWEEVWEEGDYMYDEVYFNVEEYKRPSFKVSFDTINQSYSFGDSIRVTGNARAFMGSPVSGARVVYTVKRREVVYRWWYYDRGDFTTIKTDTLLTGEKGDFLLTFPSEIVAGDQQKQELIYEYSIEATVTDVSGETREGGSSLKIGKKNLLLKLNLPESIRRGDTLQPKILATNLNDLPVPVSGSLKIYKLNGPDRVLRNRLWPAPEIQEIPEEKFKKLFPEEPYEDIPEPMDWPKEELVYEATFETNGSYEPEIPVHADWQTGKYVAVVEAKNNGNIATGKKVFDVNDPADLSLPDNQRFAVSLLEKDPEKLRLLLQTGYSSLMVHVAVYDNDMPLYSNFVQLDGNKVLEIPFKKTSAKELQLQVTGVKNNTALNETFRVQLPKTEDFLKITTQTFRSKLQPGIEETWSFKIENSKGETPDAEVLASMYDMSLDQFKTQEWNTKTNFSYTYSSFPSYRLPNIGGTSQLYNRFPSPWRYRPRERKFDQLRLFGFSMSNPNSYQYRRYLRNKENDKTSGELVGNTRGKVIDEEGLPLPGVNVIIEGSTIGTQTNFDGEFAIDTKTGDQLVFSYIGFKSEKVLINKDREIYVTLTADAAHLEEVVVTGLSVEEEIEAEEEYESILPLQGKVAGLSITANNTVKIRGGSSVSASEDDVLYIVDGDVITDYEIAAADVLSVKVLKAEDAVALYGSRGANGAVIITTKKGMEALQNVKARKDLDETAFFFPELRLGKDGKLEFSFTSPEALTQWKLRLLAHTKDWTTGSYQNTVRTQKELSVVPNAPRFLRETDTITFKTKISNLSSEAMTGTAILELYDELTMKPIDGLLGNKERLKNFRAEASDNTVVSWNLIIPEGVQAVTYRVLAKAGDFTDGEENFLPVLSNRMLVKESLPFFVRAGETETYVFKNMQENNSTTLKNHKYTLEYSSNPAWYAIQSLPYLIEFEHECSEQTFARLYANTVAGKIMNSQPKIREVFDAWQNDSSLVSDLQKREELQDLILAETPWIRDAASETAQKQLLAQLFEKERLQQEEDKALQRLEQMQQSSGAWPWFSGGRASQFITRHIVAGFGHLDRLGIELKDSKMAKKAIAYLDREILISLRESYQKEDFYHSHYLMHYLYARSFYLEEFPPSEEIKELLKKAITVNKQDWLEKDLYNKGLLMLIFTRTGETAFARKIGASLKETAVKSEDHGMYWKENVSSWFWYRAPVETQALLIEAFSELNETETVEELKIWLLQNKRTNHWPTTKATTEASYALLMQGNDWLQVDDKTLLKLGGEPIADEKLSKTEKEAGSGYRKLVWKAEEINENFSQITVENKNTTAGYGGAYWQYFENLDKIQDHGSSPLNIEKQLYLNVSGENGKTLKKITSETILQLGDLVTVRLVVSTTADMDFIHLKDMRASGFEPTNVLSEYIYQDSTAYYQSTRDAATHFFFDELRKGTYVLEYTLRANNAGKFSNGITTIESMYAPEFSGHTKGGRVIID